MSKKTEYILIPSSKELIDYAKDIQTGGNHRLQNHIANIGRDYIASRSSFIHIEPVSFNFQIPLIIILETLNNNPKKTEILDKVSTELLIDSDIYNDIELLRKAYEVHKTKRIIRHLYQRNTIAQIEVARAVKTTKNNRDWFHQRDVDIIQKIPALRNKI